MAEAVHVRRCSSLANYCWSAAYSCFASLWEAALLFSLSIQYESFCYDDLPLGSCSEECAHHHVELCRFEEPAVVCNDKSGEEYCDLQILTHMEFYSAGKVTKRLLQIFLTILTCSSIYLLKIKADVHSSSYLLEERNCTTEKIHIEMKFHCASNTEHDRLRKPKWGFSSNDVFGKVPKVPLYAAEIALLSVLVRKHFVVACCHLLMVSRASSFPSGGGYSERDNQGPIVLHVPLLGSPNKGYCAMINVGVQNSQKVCVLVDTGSYNLAIAAAPQQNIANYFNTDHIDSNFQNLGIKVSIRYSVGEWSGVLARDKISIIDSKNITEPVVTEFALIKTSENFFISGAQWEGILGMAYSSLAKPDFNVKSYWDILREKYLMKDIFAMKICPPKVPSSLSTSDEQGGELVLGSYYGLYSGPIFYTSIVKEEYYNVLITSITIADIPVSISCSEFNKDRTIVDSGTTDIHLAEKAFDAVHVTILQYFKELPNFYIPETFWTGISKLAWPSDDLQFIYTGFPTVYIGFASDKNETQEFSLGITPQIYLRQVEGTLEERNSPFCVPKCTFFVFGIKSRKEGSVIGGSAMVGFATIFDRESHRIGFALSTCQYQDLSEGSVPHIVGPYYREADDCGCHTCTRLPWWTYVSICCICVTICCIITIIISIKLKKESKYLKALMLVQSCCRFGRYRPLENVTEEERNHNGESSLHLGLSTPRVRSIRRISCTVLKKKLKHILGNVRRHHAPIQATEETISLIGQKQSESESGQPIEETSFGGSIVVGFHNQTSFKGTNKYDDNGIISLHYQRKVDECMDLHTLQKTMTQDDISSHTPTLESDEFTEQPLQQPICKTVSLSQKCTSEEVHEHPDQSTMQQKMTKTTKASQQSMLENVECGDDSTLQYQRVCLLQDCMLERAHQRADRNILYRKISSNNESHTCLFQSGCRTVCAEYMPPIKDSDNICEVVPLHRKDYITSEEHPFCHKIAISQEIVAVLDSKIAAKGITVTGNGVAEATNLEATESAETLSEATYSDNQSDDSSSVKISILDGYPKLALAETTNTVLELTNNEEQRSNGNSPSLDFSSSSSITPQEMPLDRKIETQKSPPLKESNKLAPHNRNNKRSNDISRKSQNLNRNELIENQEKSQWTCNRSTTTETNFDDDEEQFNWNLCNNLN